MGIDHSLYENISAILKFMEEHRESRVQFTEFQEKMSIYVQKNLLNLWKESAHFQKDNQKGNETVNNNDLNLLLDKLVEEADRSSSLSNRFCYNKSNINKHSHHYNY